MTKAKFFVAAAVTLALSLSAAAQPRGGYGHNRSHDRDNDRIRRVDRDGNRDFGRRGNDHDRDDFRGRGRDDRSSRRGWSHGRKTGWGNCDLPPGQAKKSGCGNSAWTPRHRSRRRPVYYPNQSRTSRRLPPPYSPAPTQRKPAKRLPYPWSAAKH